MKFIESVLSHNEGRMESAVHYLMAVLGESDNIPVSDDIGGLPQLICDRQGSEPSSPTISVDLEISEQSSEEGNDTEDLPTYKDATTSTPPPSYDSLTSSSHDYGSHVSFATNFSFTDKLRRRRRQRKGYIPQDNN